MLLFLLLLFLFIATALIFFIFKSTKQTFVKNNMAWSAKNLPIKRGKGEGGTALLSKIEQESREFLENEGFE